jgi:lipid-A-disaccharide synthase
MFVILPFEKEFYKKYDYEVSFVGHPLIDAIADRNQTDIHKFREEYNLGEKPIIALLPGSRKQEITKMLSVMLSLVDDFKEYEFVIAGAPSQDFSFYQEIIGDRKVSFINNKTYDLLSISFAALVASGTATLETALFKVPQVVCYKGGTISYQIAKRIITLKFISLVTLIMDKEVVIELIQNNFTKEKLVVQLRKILDPEKREKLFLEYFALEKILGGTGASKKVAKSIFENIKN